MNPFKYSDETISEREFMLALPSIIIGVTILSLPYQVAQVTSGSDGWIAIIIGGLIIGFFSWLGAKLASTFHDQSFFSYSSSLVTKPVAFVFTVTYIMIAITISAYVVRSFSDILKEYLFSKTPVEVLALTLILIVVYAVSGSRAGVFRLNILFLPIILVVITIIILFNIHWIELNNFFPLFQTSMKEYVQATGYSVGGYVGFGIVLFYVLIVNKPIQVPKVTLYGIAVPVILYTVIFLVTIGVFGNYTTSNLLHPTISLAKRVEFPGGIFERIESVFFVIWTMAIFNTTTISLDSAVLLIQSIFKQVKKIKILFLLAPIVYYLSMLPQNYLQVKNLATYMIMFIIPFTISVISLLFITAWIKGVFRSG
ncbi:GerAB/ArcD/ProY family transporter [Virgibacillus sp. W0181]|uniref:GerAB/ArcD/ProY family transporter n=1 Tax=Virgibacillus sp. W0181 TaxID=3391581 RepID=UPI003F4898AA